MIDSRGDARAEEKGVTDVRRQSVVRLLMVIILACSQVLVAGPSRAETPAVDGDFVTQFMPLSGLDQQVQQFPQSYLALVEQVFSGFEKRSWQIPVTVKQRIRLSFTDALNPHLLDHAIRQQLSDRLSPKTAEAALAWLRTDVGQKATQAEVRVVSPDTPLALTGFVLQLQLEPPSPQRVQLVRRLEEVTQGSALATAAWERVVLVVSKAIEAALPRKTPGGIEAFRQDVASIQADLQPLLTQGRLLELLFTYRTLTERELASYVEFLESPPGRTLTRSVNDVVQGAAVQAITSTESSLIQSLQTDTREKA